MATTQWRWKINDHVYEFASADRAPAEVGNEIVARLQGIAAVDGEPRTPYDAEIPLRGESWPSPQPAE